jgi:hypothetical protein
MTFTRTILLLPLLALSLPAQDVRYNFASNVDFHKFKTYKWVQIKGAEQLDQLADQQVKTAFEAELARKGLTRAAGDDADLLVGYQPSLSSEKQVNMYNTGFGYGPGWGYGYGYGGGGFSTATTETISIGQIDVDMYDATAKQLIWRGTVSKTLDPKAKPDKRRKNLEKAAAKLFKNYPPPVKK